MVSCHTKTKGNVWEAHILYNDAITYENRVLSYAHFAQPDIEKRQLSRLKVSDFYRDGAPLTYAEFNASMPFRLTPANFMRANMAVTAAVQKIAPQGTGLSIGQFVDRFKKGSRPFRKLYAKKLEARQQTASQLTQNYMLKANLTGHPENSECLRAWINTIHSNRQRDFLFKFYNNRLHIQTRLAHIAENVDRSCTFCAITLSLPACEETFSHLFFDCAYTDKMITAFLGELIPEFANRSINDKRKFFLGGSSLSNIALPGIITVARNIFHIILWELKLHRKAPGWQGFQIRFKNEFIPLIHGSSRSLLDLNRRDFVICRRFDGRGQI